MLLHWALSHSLVRTRPPPLGTRQSITWILCSVVSSMFSKYLIRRYANVRFASFCPAFVLPVRLLFPQSSLSTPLQTCSLVLTMSALLRRLLRIIRDIRVTKYECSVCLCGACASVSRSGMVFIPVFDACVVVACVSCLAVLLGCVVFGTHFHGVNAFGSSTFFVVEVLG